MVVVVGEDEEPNLENVVRLSINCWTGQRTIEFQILFDPSSTNFFCAFYILSFEISPWKKTLLHHPISLPWMVERKSFGAMSHTKYNKGETGPSTLC